MGYTRILEDINYNVSVSDVNFDTRGSLYGCGSIDNDLTGNYTLESQKAGIFKIKTTSSNGAPTLDW